MPFDTFEESVRKLIKEELKKRNMDLVELAQNSGVEYRTLWRFVKGRSSIRTAFLSKVLDFLYPGLLNRLFAKKETQIVEYTPKILGESKEEYITLPIYRGLAAGGPIYPERDIVGEVTIPTSLYREGIYAMLVRGNSMEPTIVDGSIVFIDTNDINLRHGKMYAFYFPYKGSVLKRVFFTTNHQVLLKSDNEDYPEFVFSPQDFENGDIKVIGRVVMSIQRY